MNKFPRIFGHWKQRKKHESSSSTDESVILSPYQPSLASSKPRFVYRNPAKNYEYAPNLSSLPSSSSLSSSTNTSLKTSSSEVIQLDAKHKVLEKTGEVDGEIHGVVSECSISDLESDFYFGKCYSAADEAGSDNGDTLLGARNVRFELNFTDWQKGCYLGQGSFGLVYEGIASNGLFFAVQEVPLPKQESHSILCIEKEIEMLSQFKHDNIVQYLGTAMDDANIYIFSELVTKGTLARLYGIYAFSDSIVSSYTRQILLGLKYLHSRHIVHRDVKCANVLVDSTGTVKLAGFGIAQVLLSSPYDTPLFSKWTAPEVVTERMLHGYSTYGMAADIWSLGCAVLEMSTGQLPYHHMEDPEVMSRILSGEPPPVPEYLSDDLRGFIMKCLQANPNARPSVAELLDHPFLKK